MPAYRLPSPYDRQPFRRRASGFALAVAINAGLLAVLMTLGIIPPPSGQQTLRGIVVDLAPQQRSQAPTSSRRTQVQRQRVATNKPLPKPPPVVLPVKRTIVPPPEPATKRNPWIEMTKDEMAAAEMSLSPG